MLLAFAVGFSAHRASICTVAAVAEVMSSRTAFVFLSFLKVVLWVVLVNELLVLWMPELARPTTAYPINLMALVGGLLFGVGAAVNDGCSFSIISKIAQGNLHVALTLPSFLVGVIVSAYLLPGMSLEMPMTLPAISERWSQFLLPVLGIWALWEVMRIVRPNLRGDGLWRGIAADRYRLSTGAAFIGICSGALYAINGRWAYSSTIVDTFIERPQHQTPSGSLVAWLFLFVLMGAIASAAMTRQFSYSFARNMWRRNVAGGFMMGFGAMLVPGGNAALILQDLPALSAHALLAYPGMVLGIAGTMMLIRRVTGASVKVICGGDSCTMEKGRPTGQSQTSDR